MKETGKYTYPQLIEQIVAKKTTLLRAFQQADEQEDGKLDSVKSIWWETQFSDS